MNNLSIDFSSSVGKISINRPNVYNALTKEAKLEIVQTIREANRNEQVKVIVLTGEGKAFCSGQDLNDRTVQAGEKPVDLGNTLQEEWNPLINAIRNSNKVIIGAINGVCAGAGLSVALACDLLAAKSGTKFVSGFAKLGLCPDAGSNFTLVRAFGYQKTLDFFLGSNPLTAEDLERVGLLNQVTDDPLSWAITKASDIAKLSPLTVAIIKKNCQLARDREFEQMLSTEVCSQRLLGNSEDYKEGLSAFFEKRTPDFKGK